MILKGFQNGEDISGLQPASPVRTCLREDAPAVRPVSKTGRPLDGADEITESAHDARLALLRVGGPWLPVLGCQDPKQPVDDVFEYEGGLRGL